jgi:hypothetical protein
MQRSFADASDIECLQPPLGCVEFHSSSSEILLPVLDLLALPRLIRQTILKFAGVVEPKNLRLGWFLKLQFVVIEEWNNITTSCFLLDDVLAGFLHRREVKYESQLVRCHVQLDVFRHQVHVGGGS